MGRGVLFLLLFGAFPCLLPASEGPNIIVILADDLGWGDLGCYGQRRIRTPHLDAMAAAGMRFTQCYAGSTVCAPSRCCLLTGLHTGHARVRGNGTPQVASLQAGDTTVATVLRQAGYRTAVIGKWGLGQPDKGGEAGVPSRQGIEESYGYLNHGHAHNYYPSHLYRNEQREVLGNEVPAEHPSGAGVARTKVQYAPDLITAEALAFVRRNKEQRFFLYWCPTIPHANNEARNQGMEVPELGDYASLAASAPAKAHAAMVSRLDRDVGRLIALLQELGLDKKTFVFFTSDNGPHKEGGYHFDMNDSNGLLRGGKRDLYEGGIRVPMLVTGPGVPPGVVNPTPWAFWDVLPTLAELANTPAPSGLDGFSVAPLLHGKRMPRTHDFLYWEFHEGGTKRAVRFGDWKAILNAPTDPLELYDLRTDPGEQKNLAAAHPDMVAKARALITSARSEHPHWPVRPRSQPKR